MDLTKKNYLTYFTAIHEELALNDYFNIIQKQQLQNEINIYYNQLIYYSGQRVFGKSYRKLTNSELENINALMESNDIDTMQLLKQILLAKLNNKNV